MSRSPWRRSSERASFRYHVVSQVRALMLGGERLRDAVRLVAARDHPTFDGRLVRVSVRSIYRWLRKYKTEGARGLEERVREPVASSTVLSPNLLKFLANEREADPYASIPELIARARACGDAGVHESICRQSVYRAFVRMGIPVYRRKMLRNRDARRFAYPHRLQMVLCDGKHFRVGAGRLRRVALFFLDNATRYGLEVVVGTSETSALFLRGLYRTLRRHGKMVALYLDRGPGFIALDTADVCRHLEINLIFGEARYPEGHGMIERFNQHAKSRLLRNLDGRPDVDPACGALEVRLQHWLFEIYNHTPHESLIQEKGE